MSATRNLLPSSASSIRSTAPMIKGMARLMTSRAPVVAFE
jgi:hypothetical protein